MPTLTVVPFREPSLADCEHFIASSPQHSSAFTAEPATSPEALAVAGLSVPSNVPERFSLAKHGREEDGAIFEYSNHGADGGSLVVMEKQVDNDVDVKVPAPPDAAEQVMIGEEPALLVRGGATIFTRRTAGGVEVTGCGWNEDTVKRIFFLRGNNLVIASAIPANAASTQELQDVTTSLGQNPSAP